MSSFLGDSVHPKRRKIISLDDLLIDYYKEEGKRIEDQTKRSKVGEGYSSGEEVSKNEVLFSQYINECEQKIGVVNNEVESLSWGINVFGHQKPFPLQEFLDFSNCEVVESFIHSELNSSLGFTSDNGEKSLTQGLLVNGWMSELVLLCGNVEKSIAVWTSNLLLYSPQEWLRELALDFWSATLLSRYKDEVKFEWLPSYTELRDALDNYGFLPDSKSGIESSTESEQTDFNSPPQNIRVWIKFVTICAKVRCRHSIFSSSEVEEMVGVMFSMFLDRYLEGLFILLSECLLSLINYFTDEEWGTELTKISHSIASRVPKDLNCLRAVECISGVDARSKQLRSAVAYNVIVVSFDEKTSNTEEILRLLIAINLKAKACDFMRVYILLCLSENWLLFNHVYQNNPLILEMWGAFLRNCSYRIGGVDLRPFALKVRTKALYLLQGIVRS